MEIQTPKIRKESTKNRMRQKVIQVLELNGISNRKNKFGSPDSCVNRFGSVSPLKTP